MIYIIRIIISYIMKNNNNMDRMEGGCEGRTH
jgi:hypothetical protein